MAEDYAARFAATYHEFPPGVEHDTLVIANGGPLSLNQTILFSHINGSMYPRQNDPGWDVSAYIDAARGPCSSYDMMVCCGESIYFHRPGWLLRLVEAWKKIGPGMYGSLSSNLVRPHLNTTGFCCPPSILAQYCDPITDRNARYAFEHGTDSFWRRVERRGMPVRLVTWDGEYEPRGWRCPNNILWRGNQTNCLMWCQHTDRYVSASKVTRERWARGADQPFK